MHTALKEPDSWLKASASSFVGCGVHGSVLAYMGRCIHGSIAICFHMQPTKYPTVPLRVSLLPLRTSGVRGFILPYWPLREGPRKDSVGIAE